MALRFGPWVMHTTDTTVRVWVWLTAPGTATVRIGSLSGSQAIDATSDHCGHVLVTGLTPDTLYAYRVEVDGVDAGVEYQFRTMPPEGAPAVFSFAVGSDMHLQVTEDAGEIETHNVECLNVLRALPDHRPRFLAIIGDFEITTTSPPGSASLATMRANAATIRAYGQGAGRTQLHAQVPLYRVWDDWDFHSNNSGGGGAGAGGQLTVQNRIDARQHHGEIYSGQPAYSDSLAIYTSWKVGDCLFVMLDNRMYRYSISTQAGGTYTPGVTPDDCYGATQIAWLKATLAANASCPLKFVFTGCNWMDHVRGGVAAAARRDSVGIFHRRERNDILEWLRDNPAAAKGMVLFTGDDHSAAVYEEDQWKEPEPLSGAGYAPNTLLSKRRIARILQIRGQWTTEHIAPGLSLCWYGSPAERFFRDDGGVWVVDVDTVQDPPRAVFRLLHSSTGVEMFHVEMVDGQAYIPPNGGYFTSGAGLGTAFEPGAFTPDSGAGTVWTPDPVP